MSKPVRKHKQYTTASIMAVYVALVAGIAITAAVVSTGGSVAGAIRMATTHQPETFTELYFVKPGQLPAYAAPGKKQTVNFHIQSHAVQRQTYAYRVTMSGSQKSTLISSSVVLPAGAGATIPFSFTLPTAGENVTITVNLVGTQQELTLRSQS